jgi:glycosyltransferase involved in cell wall biosynthesis
MAAFPRVLREVPEARLIVAGANHHTKPGYWERIREQQRGNPRIEFRGYVAEEDIPELYRTTSIVVMPYDSATGSSGPAHQACEYGVPIVCADLADFRRMAVDEDMAISFYRAGDPEDLADKLVAILRSPEQQRQLAHHNFSAAMRMTMPSVVRHYLRWFELSRHRQTMSGFVKFPLLQSRRRLRNAASIRPSWSWTLHPSEVDDESPRNPTEGSPVAGDHDLADTPNSDLTGSE